MINYDNFKIIQGRKCKEDRILLYNNKAVSFADVAVMMLHFMHNEDILYPPAKGYKGAGMIKEYIQEVLDTRKIPKDKKYQIKKQLVKV